MATADSRLSTRNVKRWRERLLHAKRVWSENGLFGTEPDSLLRIGIEFYRGNHFDFIQDVGVSEERFATANKVFSTCNSILARNSARNPSVQIFPRSQAAVESSQAVEALLAYDIYELGWKRVLNAALRHHLFAPYGIVRHGYTPRAEIFDEKGRRLDFYRAAKPDRPWIRDMKIWETLWDPRSRGLHMDGGTKWVAFQSLLTTDQIRRNPKMIRRKDLRPGVSTETRERLEIARSRNEAGPDDSALVESWVVYEAEEKTWFQLTLEGEEEPLREQDDWPIPWEWLPVNGLAVNEQEDSPFPLPLIQEVIPIQVELDRLRTMMSVMARNTRRMVALGRDRVEETDGNKMVDGELVEFFWVKGLATEAVQQLTVGGFPQELLLYSSLLEQDIREASGQSLMDRAQRINVETATEAANVQTGSNELALRIQSAFEDFASEMTRVYMAARRFTMDEAELVPILGPRDAARAGPAFLSIDPGALQEEYDYIVVPGSMLAPDHDREAARAAADLQVGASAAQLHDMTYLYERYWRSRGVDPSRVFLSQENRQNMLDALGEGRVAPEQSGRGNGSGGGVDPIMAAFAANRR